MPTKTQTELLAWLVADEERRQNAHRDVTGTSPDIEYSGGDLIDYYHQRWLRDMSSERRDILLFAPHLTAGSPRSHAWRRAGGTVLARMAKDGFMAFTHFAHGVPQYTLTDLGREIGHE